MTSKQSLEIVLMGYGIFRMLKSTPSNIDTSVISAQTYIPDDMWEHCKDRINVVTHDTYSGNLVVTATFWSHTSGRDKWFIKFTGVPGIDTTVQILLWQIAGGYQVIGEVKYFGGESEADAAYKFAESLKTMGKSLAVNLDAGSSNIDWEWSTNTYQNTSTTPVLINILNK